MTHVQPKPLRALRRLLLAGCAGAAMLLTLGANPAPAKADSLRWDLDIHVGGRDHDRGRYDRDRYDRDRYDRDRCDRDRYDRDRCRPGYYDRRDDWRDRRGRDCDNGRGWGRGGRRW